MYLTGREGYPSSCKDSGGPYSLHDTIHNTVWVGLTKGMESTATMDDVSFPALLKLPQQAHGGCSRLPGGRSDLHIP